MPYSSHGYQPGPLFDQHIYFFLSLFFTGDQQQQACYCTHHNIQVRPFRASWASVVMKHVFPLKKRGNPRDRQGILTRCGHDVSSICGAAGLGLFMHDDKAKRERKSKEGYWNSLVGRCRATTSHRWCVLAPASALPAIAKRKVRLSHVAGAIEEGLIIPPSPG
ncbi:hypothetical protein MGYG_03878 [Nannizzia gypsea CBS 118893]|uniref:Uncharacterized protein n=1 Tax=Arthroderma gypseum (strain ATCC MYA-4604 / CBS 118893) TaxID=535722 RepID=E4UUA8_ARTGP|nr:hypothetical protein MGYG_03878 [Nannizzia gypsea CBS 118893]EFR00875.1 hypothetical protein MGYG_03878 [Nannizzia gypsea CBS 118893]